MGLYPILDLDLFELVLDFDNVEDYLIVFKLRQMKAINDYNITIFNTEKWVND